MPLIILLAVFLPVIITLGFAYFATNLPFLGMPIVTSWSEMAGVFTAASAIFTGVTLIVIAFSLRKQILDGKEQRTSLQDSLADQKTGLAHLGNAAAALQTQVSQLQKSADAAERQLRLYIQDRKISRLRALGNRFLEAPAPPDANVAELHPGCDLSQQQVRDRLTERWMSNLRLLLSELHALERADGADSDIRFETTAMLNELKAFLTEQQKIGLFLAELPPYVPKEFSGSHLAQLLKHYQLFPYIEDTSQCSNRIQAKSRLASLA